MTFGAAKSAEIIVKESTSATLAGELRTATYDFPCREIGSKAPLEHAWKPATWGQPFIYDFSVRF
jgi:hypothetical protein